MADPRHVVDAFDMENGYEAVTPEPSAFHGVSEAFKGFLQDSASAGRTLMMAGAPAAIGVDLLHDVADQIGDGLSQLGTQARSRGAIPSDMTPDRKPHTEARDAYFGGVVDGLGSTAVDAWTPDTATMGSASKWVYTGARLAGMAPQAIGAPELLLANSGFDPATTLIRKGVDTKTAMAVGGANLIANAIGFGMPNAFGSTLTSRMLTGAAVNTATNAGADAVSAGVLDSRGYASEAESYDPTNGEARLTDLVVGGLFGLHAHLAPEARDAALASRNASSFQTRALPAEPATVRGVVAAQDAMETALRQLAAGEPINVPPLRTEDFHAPTAPEAAPAPALTNYPAYRRALESGGRADAKNPNSSASGADQFTESTWRRTVAAASPAWAKGLSDAELLAQRFDPTRSAEMADALDHENAKALRAAGQPVDRHTLYAAHHFGSGKAVEFARASDATPMREILSPKQVEANPYLAHLTKGETVANWDERAGHAGVELPAARAPFPDPDVVARDRALATAKEYGVPEDAALAIASPAPRDSVTGFFDGRADTIKTSLLEDAIAHVTNTDEPAHYVSADIFNLGGLNDHLGNRAEQANVHYRAMAETLRAELESTGGDVVPMRTGGDEFGAVVVNAEAPAVDAAIGRAHEKVAAYARKHGLHQIESPKRPGEFGVGLHVGRAEITRSEAVGSILDRADHGVNQSKKGGPHVTRSTAGPTGADAPEGRSGSGSRRERAPGEGVRRAGSGGQGPTPGREGEGAAAGLTPETAVDAARRLADEHPDLKVPAGVDADGNPVYRPASEVLAEIEAERQQAERDAQAFVAAANCALRRGME